MGGPQAHPKQHDHWVFLEHHHADSGQIALSELVSELDGLVRQGVFANRSRVHEIRAKTGAALDC
jgi:hypothetical protein